jgi:hypothetical protein
LIAVWRLWQKLVLRIKLNNKRKKEGIIYISIWDRQHNCQKTKRQTTIYKTLHRKKKRSNPTKKRGYRHLMITKVAVQSESYYAYLAWPISYTYYVQWNLLHFQHIYVKGVRTGWKQKYISYATIDVKYLLLEGRFPLMICNLSKYVINIFVFCVIFIKLLQVYFTLISYSDS